MSGAFLSLRKVGTRFGGLQAVNDVSFDVARGEVVSIIGPNGAGKTTLFNLLTGQLAPSSGEVRFQDQLINTLAPDERARLGLGRTFQVAKPLLGLSALENVMVGAFLHRRALRAAEAQALQVLAEVGLAARAAVRAGELTLAERRKLEVARAMAMEPSVVLLVEQHVEDALEMAKRAYVIEGGRIVKTGSGAALLADPDMQRAYMGL